MNQENLVYPCQRGALTVKTTLFQNYFLSIFFADLFLPNEEKSLESFGGWSLLRNQVD